MALPVPMARKLIVHERHAPPVLIQKFPAQVNYPDPFLL